MRILPIQKFFPCIISLGTSIPICISVCIVNNLIAS